MKVDYNPYEGRQVTGVTETVLSRGKVIIEGGKFTGKAGAGSFLKRDPRVNHRSVVLIAPGPRPRRCKLTEPAAAHNRRRPLTVTISIAPLEPIVS